MTFECWYLDGKRYTQNYIGIRIAARRVYGGNGSIGWSSEAPLYLQYKLPPACSLPSSWGRFQKPQPRKLSVFDNEPSVLMNLEIFRNLVILANLVVLVILVNLVTMTHCQDHILTENIWFAWSKTSYSGDKRRCYQAGRRQTNKQTTREDRATQPLGCWKAEFRNMH